MSWANVGFVYMMTSSKIHFQITALAELAMVIVGEKRYLLLNFMFSWGFISEMIIY